MAGPLDMNEFRESLQRIVDDFLKTALNAAEESQNEGEPSSPLHEEQPDSEDEVKSTAAGVGEQDNDNESGGEDEDDENENVEPVPLTATQRHVAALDRAANTTSLAFATLLADFKHQRNKFSVLETITDEVLSRIFLFAVTGESAKRKFVMSHVSRRWRRLFMADSRLWTSINYNEPKQFVDECIVRAKTAPIDIRYPWMFDGSLDFRTDIATVFLERLEQIRSFLINVPSEHHPLGASFLSNALPIATSITVSVIADGWGSVQIGPGPLIVDLFESNAPNLDFLWIERFGLSWNLDKFPKLTSLFLDKCYFVNPQPQTDFLTMLAHLPLLRQLSLIDVQNLCWHGLSRYDEQPIELLHLERLRLDALRLRDAVAILESITAPRDLRLTSKIRFDDDDPVGPLTSLHLRDRLPSLSTVRDLQIDLGHNNFETYETVILTGSRIKNGHDKNFMISLTGQGRQFGTQIFPAVCDPFDFSQLKRLYINWRLSGWGMAGDGEAIPMHDISQDLVYFITRCPDLEVLHLSGLLAPEILDVLCADEAGNVPCPNVTVLNLENSSFTDEGLKNLIRRRPNTKCAKLRSLNIKGSFQFSVETVEWLREQVDEVLWDGEPNDLITFETAHGH